MAFNQSINLNTYVADLPLSLRRQVLFSLVGSANAKIVNHAMRIASALAEYDYREITPREIELLAQGIDDTSTLTETCIMANVAQEWRDMLISCTGDETSGSIAGTITMLTGKQKLRAVSAAGIKRLEAVGKKVDPEQMRAMLQERLARDQARADERAKLIGFTEFVIDNVFPATHGDDDEFFSQLSPTTKEQLVEKFCKALQSGISKAIENEITGWQGDGVLSSADITIAEQAIADVMAAAYTRTATAPMTTSVMTIKDGDKTIRRIVTEPVTA